MPSSSKTRLSGITVQRHEERKQTNNSGLQRQNKLTCRREPRKTTLNHLEKTTTATKTTWVLPVCDQHSVYEALSRRCRHGRKCKVFASRTIVCLLLLFGSHASNVRQPSGPVRQALQLSVSVHHRPVSCSQDTCDWRQTGGEPSLLPAINTKRDGSI